MRLAKFVLISGLISSAGSAVKASEFEATRSGLGSLEARKEVLKREDLKKKLAAAKVRASEKRQSQGKKVLQKEVQRNEGAKEVLEEGVRSAKKATEAVQRKRDASAVLTKNIRKTQEKSVEDMLMHSKCAVGFGYGRESCGNG
jgi:hypothetical protein